jgi:hypothetical protein
MLSELVRVVSPHLRQPLVSREARARLHDVARRVPLSDLAGFECRLTAAERRVDLIVRLPSAFAVPPGSGDDRVWRRIRALAAHLHQRTRAPYRSVMVMGLEYDVPLARATVADPAVFFELNRNTDVRARHIVALARELLGRPLPPAGARIVRRCVSALPGASVPFQLGAMLSRPGHALRLVMSQMPPRRLVSYLQAIGWTGDRSAVADVLAAVSPRVESLALSLDVVDAVYPRIGIECYVAGGSRFVPGWERLLERLEQLGLCTSANAEALLAWSGVCQEGDASGRWPSHLRWGDRLLAPRARSVIARTLGHAKIVVDPRSPPEAKAYLGFAHYWIDRRAKA